MQALSNNQHHILVVDDSPSDRKLFRRIVETLGEAIVVIENADGEELWETIRNKEIKVILLDLILPKRNGLDILRELKTDHRTKDIPVIVLSGMHDDDHIKETLTLGAFDYFEKPLSDRDMRFMLAVKVKNALNYRLRLEDVHFLQHYDQLTGTLTREAFESCLSRYQIQTNIQIGVLMADINGLKIINDIYGQDAGDLILMEVSQQLTHHFGETALISRWGSDEFVIFIKNIQKQQIKEMIESCTNTIDEHKCCEYSISFGWVVEKLQNSDIKSLVKKAEDNLLSNKVMEKGSTRRRLIDSIVQALHQKNPREEQHSQRVSILCAEIGGALGLSEYEIKKVELAALMHDVGKIVIDESILNKNDKLSDTEWQQIKRHPEIGYRILATSSDTAEIANAALAHHERWDGKGYPKGLKKNEIPILARIIAVADSFDAMTGRRHYRQPFTVEQAIAEIKRCGNTQFDPIIVEAFLACEVAIYNIFANELEYVG